MAGVKLENVYKDYYGTAAVTDFCLDIPDKEIIVLFGSLGSGKSAVLKIIAGIEKQSSGNVYFDNIKPSEKLKERNCAMVFTKPALFKNKSLYDNIAYGLKLRKFSKNEIDEKISKIAAVLQIGQFLKIKTKHLPDKIKQLAQMARAFIRNPDIVLLDEPFLYLDKPDMLENFLNLYENFPATCIYATHDIEDVIKLNKKTVIINDGIIRQIDFIENIYSKPADLFVAKITDFRTNFFKCVIVKENENIVIELFNEKFELPKKHIDSLDGGFFEKPLIAALRPGSIKLKKPENFDINLKCRIDYIDEKEKFLLYGIDNETIIIESDDFEFKERTKASVYFSLDNIHLFDKETGLNILINKL